ncbi:MAG: hypothetical protein AVDCRST_MAG29-2607 [uncultured Nocardioidaceae bacterium]|uniref:DUF1232 domain-containing protein n=1 Tax=uncultured Nocardioidaceae bacterium TaxID=253824 RepID=A0A6J4MFM2_9ACTN|nr:MAG: hypothetical protein AVDCRST_MAG29-2607 [uncultured Nocardioidaceae bacterium]
MSEPSWKPLLRTPEATISKVLHSAAFVHSRERAFEIIEDPTALRELAETVRCLDYTNAPLSAVADRVAAGYRLLHARADHLANPVQSSEASPGGGARERLLVAAMHYLITPVDLVPDFRVGGYLDDVMVLSWVFGVAVTELEPYLNDPEE